MATPNAAFPSEPIELRDTSRLFQKHKIIKKKGEKT